ncbi:hypothetical protein AXK11_05850 [Cephaloticoccus primus]|uniref:Major facilitator superfamily (MFS) profile domain-containing protein n=1 Tax=Cephaloticoccus primus TaxID=1548207 RepID=A0A139SLT7_9BACT|nr:hypothetical protein AXK11_05850 [Cephaloticoccus primus]
MTRAASAAAPRSRVPTLLRKNLRYGVLDGVAAMPIGQLGAPGNVVLAALLCEMFHMSPANYGLIVSLPFWFNFLQVLITPRLSQKMDARRLCLSSAWVHFGAWVLLTASLPFIPREETPLTLTIFIIGFSVTACTQAINGVTWNGWMQDVVPQRVRGKYFGTRNQLLYISVIVFLLSVSGLTALLKDSILAYLVLFGGALVLRVFSIFALQRMITPTAPPGAPQATAARLPTRDQLRIIWAERDLMRFIAGAALFGFSINLFGPFVPVFMYEELGVSVSRANWILLFAPIGSAVVFPAWGRLLDRYGNVPVMIISLILWQLVALIWCVVDTDKLWLLYVVSAFGGMFGAGYLVGTFALMLKLTPASARAIGVALFTSLTSLAAALGPPLGGRIITWAKAQGLESLTIYHTAYAFAPLMTIFACLILRKVRENRAASITEVVGAIRNVRTAAALLGLSFFINLVFYRKTGKRRPGQPRLTRLFR